MAVIILFDLDGTLYRTHETGLPAFREICNRNGIELTPQKEAFLLYTTTDSFLRKYAPDMDSGQRAAFVHELKWKEIEAVKEHGRLFDGILDMLETLAQSGVAMAICGLGSKEYIEAVLEHCGIAHYFKAVYHRIDGLTKAQVLKTALSDMRLEPNLCIMVGDSVTDLTAAKENGLPFIGVSYGYGADGISDADVIVQNAAQLQAEIFRYLM